eukprot:g38793.t1
MIHPDQTCAVPGRSIPEILTIFKDMITYMQDRGVDTCLISLDQEKIFDRISHTYMWDVLSKMGFGERICNWILFCTNIISAVSINRTGYLKVLGIWFEGARVCTKTWEECIANVRQKLSIWEHYSLSIEGENLVIRLIQVNESGFPMHKAMTILNQSLPFQIH